MDLLEDENSLPCLSWHETKLKLSEADFYAGNIEILGWQRAKNAIHAVFIHYDRFDFHRIPAKHFSYAMYYKITDGKAIVFRVNDCRLNLDKAEFNSTSIR